MLKVVLGSLLVSIIVIVFNFISSAILARALGPEMRGVFGTIIFIVTLLSSFSQFGLGQSYIYCKRKLYFDTGLNIFIFTSVLLITAFSSTLFYFTSANLGLYESSYAIFSLLLLTTVLTFFTDITRLEPSLITYNIKQLVYAVVTPILLILVLFSDVKLTTEKAVNVALVSSIFSLLVVFSYVIKKEILNYPINFNINWQFMISYGLKNYGTSLLGIFVANFDKVFLLIKGGSIDFGIYIVAFNTSRLIGIIPQTLSNVIFGKYAGANEEGLAKTTSRVFSLIFLPMLLLGIFAAIVGEFFIPIIFGEQYVSSILPFQILIFECIISGMGWILAQRFTAAGKPGLILIRQLFSILPFLLLFVYLPPFEISVILACSMLLASSLRLVITLFIYPKVFNEARPSFIADKKDYSFIYKTFLGK